jgi:acetyl esterase/lipase
MVTGVSLGFVIPVAFWAVATLLALRPVRRPRLLARLSFRAGVVLDEVPQLLLYLLAASTVLTIADDVADPVTCAAVGVAVLTMAGLAALFRRGLRTARAVERALAVAGITARVDPRGWPWMRILLVPFLRRRSDVERIANLSYGNAGRRNRLDVYRHRSRPSGAPVLVHLHGGGYHNGRKNTQSLALIYRLASQGWVCISANYRLRPAAGMREHLIDAKKILAWLHRHGHVYGADPSVLFMSGSSAGAHLTALCALTQNEARFQPGLEESDTSVTAAICLNAWLGGYYDDQDFVSEPADYVRPDAPPFFIAHGDLDTDVTVEQARTFSGHLRTVSDDTVVYVELPGGQHAFDLFHSPRFESVVDGVEAFAASVRASRPAGTRRADHGQNHHG